MMHILLHTTVLSALPNGCYCQLTGLPLWQVSQSSSARPQPSAPFAQQHAPTPTQRSAETSTQRTTMPAAAQPTPTPRRLSHMLFSRARIFYISSYAAPPTPCRAWPR